MLSIKKKIINVTKDFFIFSIFSVLPYSRSMHVSIGKEVYEAAKGGEVTLTCSFSPANPDYTNLVLSWKADPDNVGDPMVRG